MLVVVLLPSAIHTAGVDLEVCHMQESCSFLCWRRTSEVEFARSTRTLGEKQPRPMSAAAVCASYTCSPRMTWPG